jgi:hypothetical protein
LTTDKLNRDDLKSGQKAALVIRLFYEEERRKAKVRQGERTDLKENIPPNLERGYSGETAEILAKKAGISKTNMYNLLAVYRNRPDLFERVFNADEGGK